MNKLMFVLLIMLLLLCGCHNSNNANEIEKWKTEIMHVEKAINDMAQEEGLIKAFEFYAAEDGIIRRNKRIIKGKKAITEWYTQDVCPNETLTWKPTFVDISNSGDMAFTYRDFHLYLF